MNKKYSFLLILVFAFSIQIFAQEKSKHHSIELIDSILISCWTLDPDSSIRPAKLNSQYVGRVIVQAEGDSVSLRLKIIKFVFAKLKSRVNINDTFELRINHKFGNYQAFDSLKPKIIEHLQYLRIRPTDYKNCIKQPLIFTIPVKID